MLNPDFFPTPGPVIGKMLAPYLDELDNRHILEPSAGKGDILDYIKSRRHPYRDAALYCCEADTELVRIVQATGCNHCRHGKDGTCEWPIPDGACIGYKVID